MRNVDLHMQSSQTLCRVWIVTLSDQTQMGFTDHDRILVFQNIKCSPQSGFTPGETDARLGFSVNTGSIMGVLDAVILSVDDIRNGRFDNARIESYRVDWTDVSHFVQLGTGYMGEIRQKGAAFEAEWLGEGSRLERSTGRVFARICDAEFGDARCGLDPESFPEGTACSRTFEACQNQFSNTVNFRGFPYLIGDDAMVAGPKEGEPRDGGSRYV